MKSTWRGILRGLVGVGLAVAVAAPAWSASHLWVINEVFSDSSGNLQFVEMFCPAPNETGLMNKDVSSNGTDSDPFTSNLPPNSTQNKHMLLATADFAALPGVPTPDLIIPNNFLSTGADSIIWHIYGGSVLSYTAGQLPTDAVQSLVKGGTTGSATPTNFAGGAMPPPATNDLTVAKFPQFPTGARLSLTWNSGSCMGEAGRHIIMGSSSDLPASPGGTFSVSAGKCTAGASPFTWASVPLPASGDMLWFLALADNGVAQEGSWGTDSSGAERVGPMPGSGASGVCTMITKSLANTCGN